MLYLLTLFIGVVIGVCILLPKIKNVKLDTEKQLEDLRQIQSEIMQVENNKISLEKEYNKIYFEIQNFRNETNLLISKKKELQSDIKLLQEQASENADAFYKDKMKIASMKFQQEEIKMQNHFNEQKEKAEKEYLDVLAGLSTMVQESTAADKEEIDKLEKILKELKIKVTCAVEANKREEEIRTQEEFYKLVIPKEDLEEIQKLREVGKYLRNKEPLNKIIWSIYYMKPTTDLIGRVVGSSVKTGIYKITNLTNQKCYVGQAVNYWPMKNFSQLPLGVFIKG